MKTLLLMLLRAYQWGVSPFLGQNCRFFPSCSHYATEAIAKHGAWKGSALTVKRLCKCHPWHPGGIDLVPEKCSPTSCSPTSSTSAAAGHGCSHSCHSRISISDF